MSDPQILTVDLGARSYDIQVGHGLLEANPAFQAVAKGRSVAIVSDSNVDPLYGHQVELLLAPVAHQVVRIVVPAGESSKCWEQLDAIHDRMLEAHLDRKSLVVAADEREAGVRAHLNFGHTFGHAVEVGAGYGKWLHGEAVAAGMVMAADLSVRLGRMPATDMAVLVQAIEAAGLPVKAPQWPVDDYLRYMSIDKKADRGTPVFVVLDGLGKAATTRADEALVREVIATHLG